MVPVMMTARLDFELFLSLFRGIDFVLVLLGASAEAGPGPARYPASWSQRVATHDVMMMMMCPDVAVPNGFNEQHWWNFHSPNSGIRHMFFIRIALRGITYMYM